MSKPGYSPVSQSDQQVRVQLADAPSAPLFTVLKLPREKDYTGWSICSSICCCFVFGVVALVYSIKTQDMNWEAKNQLARTYSRKSKLWNKVACLSGTVIFFSLVALVSYCSITWNSKNDSKLKL